MLTLVYHHLHIKLTSGQRGIDFYIKIAIFICFKFYILKCFSVYFKRLNSTNLRIVFVLFVLIKRRSLGSIQGLLDPNVGGLSGKAGTSIFNKLQSDFHLH